MSKYKCSLILRETGECVKEDTRLRIAYIIKTMGSVIPEKYKAKIVELISHDAKVLDERLS